MIYDIKYECSYSMPNKSLDDFASVDYLKFLGFFYDFVGEYSISKGIKGIA